MNQRQSIYKVSRFIVALLALVVPAIRSSAQAPKSVELSGTVYEQQGGKMVPLDYATVLLPDIGTSTPTDKSGKYRLRRLPVGKTRIRVTFVGKIPIDTVIVLQSNRVLNFVMKEEDFKIKEIRVTAQVRNSGKSSAQYISRTAMDHIQATSLNDLMALLPGGLTVNPTLNYAQQLNIRQVASSSKASSMNSLGSSVIRDGAPISNNANLQSMNPMVAGSASALGGGSGPEGGIDLRDIPTDNIESVEVVTGIPSVEYGDLTSGAVIIHSKAGKEPFRLRGKINPAVYQVSLGKGLGLGKNAGALNLSGDYAYNVNKPTAAYTYFQRATAKALYSNTFFDNLLRSHTSLDLLYKKDSRDANPDDTRSQTSSEGRSMGFTLNTNGSLNINRGWLRSIRYVLSQRVNRSNSFYESVYSVANAPYSGSMVDGTVLSNFPGKKIYDAEGDEVTHFTPQESHLQAYYLPNDYKGRNEIDSRELNTYAKISANLFTKTGKVNHRILFGADYRLDGNTGKGKTFAADAPPYRILSQLNSTFRPRPYSDIPFITHWGAFAEENMRWSIGERVLDIQAGVRYDHATRVGGLAAPRLNFSLDLLPGIWRVRGGYGVTAKMPTLLYLFPERAYFEYINYSDLTDTKIPESDRLFVTTTRIFETDNPELRIARNRKLEIGTDLQLGKTRIHLNAYHERLSDGYTLGQDFSTFHPVKYAIYDRVKDGNLKLRADYPVLSDHFKPLNALDIDNRGIEGTIDFGRFDAIRTAFILNGAYTVSHYHPLGYDFYYGGPEAPDKRTPIAVYDSGQTHQYDRQAATSLRIIHNIPEIGFVVSLTAEAVWLDSDYATYGNDSIPVGYLDLEKGDFHPFEAGTFANVKELKESSHGYMYRNPSRSAEVKESYPPYFCLNMHLTKEIGELMRISFFANNLTRSYPIAESKRSPGSYTVFNNRFYFGLELSLTL